jgi:hypothetical protein
MYNLLQVLLNFVLSYNFVYVVKLDWLMKNHLPKLIEFYVGTFREDFMTQRLNDVKRKNIYEN